MTKPVVADIEFRVNCLRIEPVVAGAPTVRLCAYPYDLTMSNSEIYLSGSGFQFTGYDAAANLAPGMVDLEALAGVGGVSRDAIASGVFDNARAYLFATSYVAPVEDEEEVVASILGKTTLRDERYAIQEFALVDVLSQSQTDSYSPTCPKEFGGQEFGGCGVALGPLTDTGTLTGVTDQSTFQDTGRAEAADYFAAGAVRFTTGGNAALAPYAIKAYAADGTITVYEPYPFTVQAGDAYEIIPGCRKRLEDCKDKWTNVTRFGGFTFVPVKSKYSKIGSN